MINSAGIHFTLSRSNNILSWDSGSPVNTVLFLSFLRFKYLTDSWFPTQRRGKSLILPQNIFFKLRNDDVSFIRKDVSLKGTIKITKIPSSYQHMWVSLRWRQCVRLQQHVINLAESASLAWLYMSTVLNHYVQFCTFNPRAQGKLGNIFNYPSWKFLFPSLNLRSFRPEKQFHSHPIPEVQAKRFSSLHIPEGCRAGTKNVNKMGQKRQKEIRANETFF